MNWKPLNQQEIESITSITGIGCKTCGNSDSGGDSGRGGNSGGSGNSRSENGSLISSLAPTCPTSNKNVGDIVHMSARPVGGTAPYTVSFKKDTTLLRQLSGVTEGQIVTYDYTVLSTDAGITHVFSNSITDSCIYFSAKTCTEQCSITINAACIPNWQCESGYTGYEADGCGNRRLSALCILPTCGTPACNLVIT